MTSENPIPTGYDEAAVRRARQMRSEAMSVAEIARATGYSLGWVKRAVKGEPVPPELRRRYAKDAEREKAIAMRAAGEHPKVIATELGVTVSTVYHWLAGTSKSRPRDRRDPVLSADHLRADALLKPQVLELRKQRMAIERIASSLRVSPDRVRRVLAEPDVPAELRGIRPKHALREQARTLRMEGQSIPDIARLLDVAKSTVWNWTKDLPVPEEFKVRGGSMRQRAARSAFWSAELARRELQRTKEIQCAFEEVGSLSDRDLRILGAVLYWAEGAKSKPYQRRELVRFVNSDPSVIRLFMHWLELCRVDKEKVRFRLQIHETADVVAALAFWAGVVGVPASGFEKTSLKRHNPKTNRLNRDNDQYHGCLTVRVLQSATLYRQIEGLWSGVVAGVQRRA